MKSSNEEILNHVGIYIRVSTEEQAREGFSISAQREKLKAFCHIHDWDSYKFYVDEGISGKDTQRPQLQLMLEHIKQGHINTVLVYRLDRLTRSVLDLYQLLDVFEKNNCKFKSATEVYDTTTAMGRMFITLVAAMAQWERENLGERVRMGQIEKARQGKYSAKAPFGYDKDQNDVLVINKSEKEIIIDMIKKLEQGYSLRQLALYMDNTGAKPVRGYQWHITSVKGILTNPALYGATKWREEIIKNTHEPIISEKKHNQVKDLLKERQLKKKRKVNSFFIYQMKLLCPNCGNHLTSERSVYKRKKDGGLTENNHYRCQACALNKRKPIGVSELKIDKAFVDYMKKISFDATPKLEEKGNDEKELYLKQISIIKKQREKYQKAWGKDLMTDEEFEERMRETKESLNELESSLEQLAPAPIEVDQEHINQIVTNFNRNWSKLTPREKHQFLNTFIKSIHFEKHETNVEVIGVSYY
ncbi:recombinase family protein [Rossellomorea sp. y25]|uniref:recombinase family protein n=1 Tax=Rossellomorea sp. y25 TaxID=3118174 RepID=UPI0030E2380F